MSNKSNQFLTFLSISLTVVSAGGILWFLGTLLGEAIWVLAKKNSQPNSLELRENQRSSEKIQLNLVGNRSFSGYTIFRQPEFKKMLAREYGIALNYQEYNRNKKINLLKK